MLRIKYLFIFLIDIYRYCISPFTPQSCRFYPSCSNYAREAVKNYGVLKGGYLSIKRLSKCHPYHEGGFDPVPNINNQDIYNG